MSEHVTAEQRAEWRAAAVADSRLRYPTKGRVQECLYAALDALEAAEDKEARWVEDLQDERRLTREFEAALDGAKRENDRLNARYADLVARVGVLADEWAGARDRLGPTLNTVLAHTYATELRAVLGEGGGA